MFDANSYRKEVLKPLLDKGEHDVSDPFAVVGLDPSVDDEELIRQRMGEVVAFWRKEQSSPRYKGLVSSLLAQQDAISAQLLDAGRRAAARTRVQGAAQASDAAAATRVDELLDALERRHGGIPRDRLDRLRSLAAREGITAAQIDARLAGRTLVDERADTVPPIPATQRRQVVSLLTELERLDRSGGGAHRTLYGFLGLPVGAGTEVIEARREAIDTRNRQRRHDRLRTVVDELLALTGTLLVDGDPLRYLAGIEEGVKEEIRPAIETAVLLEDRVSAAESERLTREAVSAGLAPDVARDLVVEVARELNAAIDVGSIADYVVCATCNATNVSQDGVTTCSRCGSDLYRSCPRCGTTAARSDVRCSSCQFDLRAYDEAAEDLARAADDLDAGRLGAAAERVTQAAAWGDDLPDLIRLRERVDSAGRTADDAWDNLLYALDGRRVDDARRYVSSLGRIASDRPGPDGTTLDDAGSRVDALEAELATAVASASGASADEREAALLAVLDRFPAASAVAEALADIGVRPASEVVATRSAGGIEVRWSASPSPGPIEYRVARTIDRSGGATTPLGRTTDVDLTDAGAPAGEPVTYAVVATRLGITADEARSDAIVHAPAVADLEAVGHDGAVELRWRAVRAGEVWVERSQPDDPDAMSRKLRGGPTGALDTAVRSGTRYRYEVVTEYPATATSSAVRSSAAAVEAVAFTLPDAPPAPTVAPSGRSITVTVPAPPPGVEAVILRARSAPGVAPGSVIDDAARRSIGGALAGTGGTGYDSADGGPRWYVPVHAVGGQNVVGPAVAHPGVAEVERVRVEDGMLRWQWPPSCTEAVIHWSTAPEPVAPGGPGVSEARTTNTAYEIKGGWPLPDGARSFLVLAAARIDGQRTPLPGWSAAARAVL